MSTFQLRIFSLSHSDPDGPDSSTQSPTSLSPSVSTTSTINPAPVCVSGWGPWINKNDPSADGASGDYEKLSPAELQVFCPNGQVTDIQCIDAGTGDPADTADSLAEGTCDLDNGLECENLPFPGVPPCHDYQIRYMCNCSGQCSILDC